MYLSHSQNLKKGTWKALLNQDVCSLSFSLSFSLSGATCSLVSLSIPTDLTLLFLSVSFIPVAVSWGQEDEVKWLAAHSPEAMETGSQEKGMSRSGRLIDMFAQHVNV